MSRLFELNAPMDLWSKPKYSSVCMCAIKPLFAGSSNPNELEPVHHSCYLEGPFGIGPNLCGQRLTRDHVVLDYRQPSHLYDLF